MLQFRCCAAALLCLFSVPVLAQRKLRVVVIAPVDHASTNPQFKVAQKAADAIEAALTQTGKYIIVDHDTVNKNAMGAEKNQVFDGEFDDKSGVKTRMQKVADLIVFGTIDQFNATQSTASKGGLITSKSTVTGTANLAITLKLESLETTEILTTANAGATKTGVISESSSNAATTWVKVNGRGLAPTTQKSGVDATQALLQLIDQDIAEVSQQLVDKLTKSDVRPGMPKIIAVMDGSVMINKGTNVGMETGKTYDLVRVVGQTRDPDTGEMLPIRKKICMLTIVSVDDKTSEGKCPGGAAAMGDELKAVSK